jgi:hypothetical protein
MLFNANETVNPVLLLLCVCNLQQKDTELWQASWGGVTPGARIPSV